MPFCIQVEVRIYVECRSSAHLNFNKQGPNTALGQACFMNILLKNTPNLLDIKNRRLIFAHKLTKSSSFHPVSFSIFPQTQNCLQNQTYQDLNQSSPPKPLLNRLLPLIEAFFVLHGRLPESTTSGGSPAPDSPKANETAGGSQGSKAVSPLDSELKDDRLGCGFLVGFWLIFDGCFLE